MGEVDNGLDGLLDGKRLHFVQQDRQHDGNGKKEDDLVDADDDGVTEGRQEVRPSEGPLEVIKPDERALEDRVDDIVPGKEVCTTPDIECTYAAASDDLWSHHPPHRGEKWNGWKGSAGGANNAADRSCLHVGELPIHRGGKVIATTHPPKHPGKTSPRYRDLYFKTCFPRTIFRFADH